MKDSSFFDVVIIGGGAAGLAASVFLARKSRQGHSIALLEKAPRVGRKLLATGNGTCNISNSYASLPYYHGNTIRFIEPALKQFSPADACRFFRSIGVECVQRENGRIYPLCEQAAAVLDCLRLEMQTLGVQEICDSPAMEIQQHKKGFRILIQEETIQAKRILVCTGGAASPKLGGSSEAYSLLTALGHTRTPLFPSIVQVKTDTRFVRAVKGIRTNAQAAFALDGHQLDESEGEILFTEYGISGPAIMQISRCVSDWERRHKGQMTVQLNLLPGMDGQFLRTSLESRVAMKGRTLNEYLTGLLNKRLGQTVLRAAGYDDLSRPVSTLEEKDIQNIVQWITGWTITVSGTQGMGGAQVTAGGIQTSEFNNKTMESKKIPGLYAAGEVLDIDGDCGGFNLQWAWASANLAAVSICDSLK